MRYIAIIILLFLLSCVERNYDPPSGYKVTLFLKGGIFADNTSDRVHGGILQPTAMKNVPRLIPSEPYLRWDLPFAGWNTDPYGTGEFYVPETVIDKDVTLYAIYGAYIYDAYTLNAIECNNPFRVYVLMNSVQVGYLSPLCPDPARPFRGKLFGNGYTVRYATQTTGGAPSHGGLFAYMDGSTVYNLNINVATSIGSVFAGGLAGHMKDSTANKVSVTGNIRAPTAGGIAGEAYLSSIINSRYGDIDPIPTDSYSVTASGVAAGGLVGHATGSRIINSTVDGTVITASSSGSAGGLAGAADRTEIRNSLHSGNITGDGATVNLGGLVGSMNNSWIESGYSNSVILATETGGSVVGSIVGSMVDSSVTKSAAFGIMIRGGRAGRIVGRLINNSGYESLSENYARDDILVNYKPVTSSDTDGISLPLSSMRKNHDFFTDTLGWDTRLYWRLPPHYEYPRLEWEVLPRFIELNYPEELFEINGRFQDEYGEYINEDNRGWFVLTRDIDMAGYNWRAIGTVTEPFQALLDGNGYAVKNLSANFFGYTQGLRVYDLNMINSTGYEAVLMEIGYGGRLENITASGSVRNGIDYGAGGIAGVLRRGTLVSRCSFAGEILSGNVPRYVGGIIGDMDDGFLLYSSSMGVAGVRSGSNTSAGTSAPAAAGGLVGSANNIIAVNNYSSMDLYSTGGSASNAGGLFGNISNSVSVNGYAAGDIYAATRYHTSASKLMPSVGGIAGYAENSDIRDSAYFGKNLTTEYYDVLGTGGAERYAAGAFARSDNLTFSDIYSNSDIHIIADNTASGIYGSVINLSDLTESFYRDSLGLNFDTVWRSLNPGDIRDAKYPVFKRERDILYPPADGDEWYWYSVRKYYEDF